MPVFYFDTRKLQEWGDKFFPHFTPVNRLAIIKELLEKELTRRYKQPVHNVNFNRA